MILFFEKIIDVLEELNIPYMLSGSVAMGIHIIPRSTRDFDFVVYMKQSKVLDFIEKLPSISDTEFEIAVVLETFTPGSGCLFSSKIVPFIC